MASFLKNTGDIILDAVLTDEGRRRLALGDGTFKITKFALGDDEIDYGLWDSDAPTGLEDLNITRTPIFEAYTNNVASMKNKLMTLAETNILFLPVLKLLNKDVSGQSVNALQMNTDTQTYILPVYTTTNPLNATGQLKKGENKKICIDQGLDSSDLDKTLSLFDYYPNLVENTYNVHLDSRLMQVEGKTPQNIDDDYIAMYSFSFGDGYVIRAEVGSSTEEDTGDKENAILGNRGTRLLFKPITTMQIEQSGDSLFRKLGSLNVKFPTNTSNDNYDVIRTNITITGATTGYSIQIPVILARKS